jgi:lon-related putative ATP-dependent protease
MSSSEVNESGKGPGPIKTKSLTAKDLYQVCDPEQFVFETTADLEDELLPQHQKRAVESLKFGMNIEKEGYNIFALGHSGIGKFTLVHQFLEDRAKEEAVPADICYVNNFEKPQNPSILQLPSGQGKELADDMKYVVDEIGNVLRAAFENEEFQNRQQSIAQEFADQQEKIFKELQKEAEERNLGLIRTPTGFAFGPMRDGEVMPPEEFKKLSKEEQDKVEKQAQELQQKAQKIFQTIPKQERELRQKAKELSREITRFAIEPLLEDIRKKYEKLPKVLEYLGAVENDIVDNAEIILQQKDGQLQEQQQDQPPQIQQQNPLNATGREDSTVLRHYSVNVVVDHSNSKGAPVIHEPNPTYQNLLGRVEHLAHMGTLMTDFNMIRAGALHKANGGYLILDAIKVLTQPFAWEGLKRALQSRKVKIESLGQTYSLISTVSLDPEPMKLNVKVALTGPPLLYYLLRNYDPEFGKLFKVAADFDNQMVRSRENQEAYGRLIASVGRKEGLRPFDRGAVARVIEQSARTAEDKNKLSAHLQNVTDLLRESDYWAKQNGNGTVCAADVQKAINSQIYRLDRMRERMQEHIARGTILIDTEGTKVGQVNGLSVISLGDFSFGQPSRITARIRLGKGEVIDIEREVEMGGPIHSKGVLILTGFLGARYAMNQPLSLSASLVFEQSYSGVEGDSASSAELYALLSAIAELPLKQSYAVTGSVNQHGQVQPIGGVNEKIEGFFDICKAKSLTGDQGVIIPASNVKNLMLRNDVIEAVGQGKFHVYAVETIDQGMELLAGLQAGKPDNEGIYPEDSINGKVQKQLENFAERQKKFSASAERANS